MGFFQDIKDTFTNVKDDVIADNLRAFINSEIKEYGEMVKLKIDSQAKNIHTSLILEGESSEINLVVYGYSVVTENNEKYLKFTEIDTNRVWFTKLFKNVIVPQALPGKKIKIDSKIATLVDILL